MNIYLYIIISNLLLSGIFFIVIFKFYINPNYIKITNLKNYLIDYQNLKIQIKILEYQIKIQNENLVHITQEKKELNKINIETEKEISGWKIKHQLVYEKFIELMNKFNENKNIIIKYHNEEVKIKETLSEKNIIIEHLQNQLQEYKLHNQSKDQKLEILNLEKNQIHENLIILQNENMVLKDKYCIIKKEILDIQNQSRLEFTKIANQIIENQTKNFTHNNEYSMQMLLNPLKENLENFKKKVEDTYNKESKERFCLDNRINELIKNTNKISTEANNLAAALKNQNQIQGNWGELILETILENSGLKKNLNYKIQNTLENTEGKHLRPDVLIYLPDNRMIIIDSKVSLLHYNNFFSETNENKKTEYLKKHIKSITQHIDQLSQRKYDDLKNSLNFTIMFIPIEPAYLIAYQANTELWNYAYKKRILLVSPTNLITSLKIIADLWTRESQSKNAYAIVERAEKMYEKFIRFTDNLLELGKNLQKIEKNYSDSINQLYNSKGNLIHQANQLKTLGLKSNKQVSSKFDNINKKFCENIL